jgi:hypothetical protein
VFAHATSRRQSRRFVALLVPVVVVTVTSTLTEPPGLSDTKIGPVL